MTLLEVINRVKFLSHRGDQAITTDQTTKDIVMAVNIVVSELAKLLPRQAFRTEVTIPTIVNTEIYPLVTGTAYPVQELIEARYVFSGVNYNIVKIESEREFWNQYYVVNNTNRPYIYCPWGLDTSKNKQVRLFPIPNDIYSVVYSYYIDPTTVILTIADLATELPFLQSYLQDPFFKGALAYYLRSFDDPGAPMAMQEYERSKIIQDAAEDSDQDGDLQLRFDTGRRRFVDPGTGIRLQ